MRLDTTFRNVLPLDLNYGAYSLREYYMLSPLQHVNIKISVQIKKDLISKFEMDLFEGPDEGLNDEENLEIYDKLWVVSIVFGFLSPGFKP